LIILKETRRKLNKPAKLKKHLTTLKMLDIMIKIGAFKEGAKKNAPILKCG
jgi:hypothetical protein